MNYRFTTAALLTLAALLTGGCGLTPSRNPRPSTLPDEEEGGPELPAESAPRRDARPSSTRLHGGEACSIGDVNGDRVPDFAIGVENAVRANGECGALWVVSGRSGKVLFVRGGDRPGGSLGAAVAAAGDINRDGAMDVIVGEPAETTSEEGVAYVLSGRDGAVLFELRPAARAYGFGSTVAGAGDVDADGFPDLAVGSHGPALATVFSGRDGSVLLTVEGTPTADPTPLLGVGDLNADGHDDLALGTPSFALPATEERDEPRFVGRVRVISGADGSTLLDKAGERDAAELGAALARAGDVDKDGGPDLLVGAPPFHASVLSGRDGSVLRTFTEMRSKAGVTGYGASVATLGDLDGDEVIDYAVSSGGLRGVGREHFVAIHGGSHGALLGRLEFGVDRARVSAAGDVDRDGIQDLLVSFPELGIARVYSGSSMALLLHIDPLERGIDDLGMEIER